LIIFIYHPPLIQIDEMTAIRRTGRRYFEVPHVAVSLILIANVICYCVGAYLAHSLIIPSDILIRSGAMYPSAIANNEYWRLISYGFVHSDPIHLFVDIFCLALWGGHLEKRIGSTYFIVIYISSTVAGGVLSASTLSTYVMVLGAASGISGIVGALFCLWILGKTDLPISFFAISLGLNAALAAFVATKIGWSSNLGGFTFGLISCALLDLLERAIGRILRCKFPEFVKMNFCVLVTGFALALWAKRSIVLNAQSNDLWLMAAFAILSVVSIKIIDVILSLKKGLAVTVIVLSAGNAALVLLIGNAYSELLFAVCSLKNVAHGFRDNAFLVICNNTDAAIYVAGAAALGLTVVLYFHALLRGVTDVGFVGATLCAERGRRHGI
jgi:membrane associated rhomboid family serine protease